MNDHAASPVKSEHPSPGRQRWETPRLRVIPVGEGTEVGKGTSPTETTPTHGFGPS